MAHLLETLLNGQAAMTWTNEKPWHGLGTEMAEDATPMEHFLAAGLDWTVSKRPMFLQDGTLVKNSMLLCRDTDHHQYSIVGPDWQEVQNEEIFRFYNDFMGAGHIKMETAGSIRDGSEIWALGKIAHRFSLPGDDEVQSYLLFHSAHIYGKGNSLRATSTRVVCNNTLQVALKDNSKVYRMPHTRAFTGDVQKAAAEAVGMALNVMQVHQEQAELLARTPVNQRKVEEVIASVYQPDLLTEDRLQDPAPLRADFAELASNVLMALDASPGAELKSSRGTAWGLLNAVTYVEDHMSTARTRDNAFANAFFGAGSRRKEAALQACLKLAA